MPRIPFRVDGWLPARGANVWFGAGSTGKTQLLLWMAAMIASRPEYRAPTWLGGTINGTGHVLILSAEDTGQQIIERLRNILHTTMGQDAAMARETSARLHVMPFLSMSEAEFRHPNASLFRLAEDRVWRASEVLTEVREYIKGWNARHDDPEDQIVGVVMDSATSMAGFDSMDEGATTNFFFYLNRMCETMKLFFTIIGHVPKGSTVPQKDPWGTAAARLRGVAIWTTAPRMVVEVRFIQEWHLKRNTVHEAKELRERLPGVRREDILVVYAAKANLQGVCRDPRYLVRVEEGAFRQVDAPKPGSTRPGDAKAQDPGKRHNASSTTPAPRSSAQQRADKEARYRPGTPIILRVIKRAYPNIAPGDYVIESLIKKTLDTMHGEEPFKARRCIVSSSGSGAGIRIGGLSWHLQQLAEAGVLTNANNRYRFARWPDPSPDEA
ncbi:AAA domain-containing protein [Sphingomonas palmae]|uniref:AAA domain-containing protein n=2 Tax=Sphingomonas palmae TaxID=1855283 RepID=A0A1H7UTS8_9SPHN|nr:AAA domain-containing protein [Sphingomonas palmae]